MQVLPLVAGMFLVATSTLAQAQQAAEPALLTQPRSAADTVYERRMTETRAGNLDGVMALYADDAVLVINQGATTKVFTGKAEVRSFLSFINSKNLSNLRAMEATTRPGGNDSVVMRWAQGRGTPKFASGTDVFVVRNGKIAVQTVQPDATPTWP